MLRLYSVVVFYHFGVHGYHELPLYSLCETLERLCGLGNVTRGFIDIVATREWILGDLFL